LLDYALAEAAVLYAVEHPREHAGRVRDGLLLACLRARGVEIHRVHAEVGGRDLEGAAGAGAGLFKDERDALALAEPVRDAGLFLGLQLRGEVQQRDDVPRLEVEQLQKILAFEIHSLSLLSGAGGDDDLGRLLYELHGDVERGQQPHLAVGGEDEDALLHAFGHDLGGGLRGLEAYHEAEARDLLYAGLALEGGEEVLALGAHLRQQRLVYAAEDTQRAGADGGAAAEGRAVRAGGEGVFGLLSEEAGAYGQAAAQALGRGHDVRREAVLLPGVEA